MPLRTLMPGRSRPGVRRPGPAHRLAVPGLLLHVLCVPLVLAIAGAGVADATGFDFSIDRFEVTGANPFVDDFSDGSTTTPPTSSFVPTEAKIVVAEGGGLLRLTDSDGAGPLGFANAQGTTDTLLLNATPLAGVVDGAGPASLVTTWSGTLPMIVGNEYTRFFAQSLRWQNLSSVAQSDLAVVAGGLAADIGPAACRHLGPQVVATYTAALLGVFIACDPIDPVDVTGAIVLRIDFDDAGDALSYAYSLDGGTTFVPSSSWAAPVTSQPVLPMPTGPYFALPIFGAGAAEYAPVSVPGPGAWTALGLLVAGLGLAFRTARRRARSGP